jgi:hypothetical protein
MWPQQISTSARRHRRSTPKFTAFDHLQYSWGLIYGIVYVHRNQMYDLHSQSIVVLHYYIVL